MHRVDDPLWLTQWRQAHSHEHHRLAMQERKERFITTLYWLLIAAIVIGAVWVVARPG